MRTPGWLVLTLCVVWSACNCNQKEPECQFDSQCPSGQVCNAEKMCVSRPTCPETPCANGQVCAPNKRCYAKDCPSGACGAEQVCNAGQCVDTVCLGMSCGSGTTCVKGTCVPQSCSGETCQSSEVCIGGACTSRLCVEVTCPAAQRCAGGMCYPTQCGSGAACSPTQVCVGGTCVEDRCVGVTCPSGNRCANGQCTPTECNGNPCPGNQVCDGTRCVDPLCAFTTCPAGYACAQGLCLPASSDGGIPRLPDGGPAVIIGPDGGIIGVGGPDGGPSRLPDGGIVGGPCRPSQCAEIACNNGIDDDNNGSMDCEDVSCEAQTCRSNDPCALRPVCRAAACTASGVLTCNSPPTGDCYLRPGQCLPGGTCNYAAQAGAACDGGTCDGTGVCRVGGGTSFNYPPHHFNPSTLVRPTGRTSVADAGTAQFNSSPGGGFSGAWTGTTPTVSTVTLPSGQEAVVLTTAGFDLPFGSSIVLNGTRPVIFAVFGDANINGIINASAVGPNGGPGSNPPSCAQTAGNNRGGDGGSAPLAGGGGGGAGLIQTGGIGGPGSDGGASGRPGLPRSNTYGTFQGGCPGGNGGKVPSGRGGGGGGAVQISASGAIHLNGEILALGGGGQGGQPSASGGGGGGSGGYIVLEASLFTLLGGPTATYGGGGGEGASDTQVGIPGEDGQSTGFPADGGSRGTLTGGRGGGGGVIGRAPGNGTNGIAIPNPADGGWIHGGGGGGGGSAGLIRISLNGTGCYRQQDFEIFGLLVDENGNTCP